MSEHLVDAATVDALLEVFDQPEDARRRIARVFLNMVDGNHSTAYAAREIGRICDRDKIFGLFVCRGLASAPLKEKALAARVAADPR